MTPNRTRCVEKHTEIPQGPPSREERYGRLFYLKNREQKHMHIAVLHMFLIHIFDTHI